MENNLKIGAEAESRICVGKGDTALARGSGDMDVFATPAMIALAENAAMKAVAPFLGEGETTVGSMIAMSHLKPTAPGDTVAARARLVEMDGRKLTFAIEASDSEGEIGEGRHIRYIVNREKFLSKLK